jgi:hypothetical protein
VSDKDTPQAGSPSLVGGGYRGTHDPGQPVSLMQPQVNPAGQAGGQPAGNAASQGATNQGGSAGRAAQASGSS